MKLLMVRVGEGSYAIASDAVSKIIDPSLDPGFRRIGDEAEALYAGSRIPVVEIEPGTGQPGALYLLLERSGARALLRVDGATTIQDVPGAAIAPLPSFIFESHRRLVRGIFSDGGAPRLVVNLDALL